MSLVTGRVVRRNRWNELPMPQDVVDRVSAIGHQQGMPQTLTFPDAYGREMYDAEHDIDDDHDDDYEYVPADDVSLEYDSEDDFPAHDDAAEMDDNSEDIDDSSNDESGNASEGGNDVDEDEENIAFDFGSITSNGHSIVQEGSDRSKTDGEDFDGDLESATTEILDDGSNTGVDGRTEGVTEPLHEGVNDDIDGDAKPGGGPSLRPRGEKKDPTHILGGYAQPMHSSLS
jgi:hypothetical protein